jgi:hypothetical protein
MNVITQSIVIPACFWRESRLRRAENLVSVRADSSLRPFGTPFRMTVFYINYSLR